MNKQDFTTTFSVNQTPEAQFDPARLVEGFNLVRIQFKIQVRLSAKAT